MKAVEIRAAFPSEAFLCDCFIAGMRKAGGWTVYPETAGFDILATYDATGHQLGVEAKLSLNAKVADQILPDQYMGYGVSDVSGPDFRAVIVPQITESSAGIAKMLGILGVMVWTPEKTYSAGWDFHRIFDRQTKRAHDSGDGPLNRWDMAWHDWNPSRRCALPEIVPQVRAGVPSPLQLTPWKIGALRVMVQLDVDGFVTAKSVRECGVDARRFCAADGWLLPLGSGRWGRGTVPAFDQQHPEAFAQLLEEFRAQRMKAFD